MRLLHPSIDGFAMTSLRAHAKQSNAVCNKDQNIKKEAAQKGSLFFI